MSTVQVPNETGVSVEGVPAGYRQTGSGTEGRGQPAGQVPGEPPKKEYWRIVHDAAAIWQRMRV